MKLVLATVNRVSSRWQRIGTRWESVGVVDPAHPVVSGSRTRGSPREPLAPERHSELPDPSRRLASRFSPASSRLCLAIPSRFADKAPHA